MSILGYMGDQLGHHREHFQELELISYAHGASIVIECHKCGEIVADLYIAQMEYENEQ